MSGNAKACAVLFFKISLQTFLDNVGLISLLITFAKVVITKFTPF